MRLALRSAFGSVSVAPRQLASTKFDCNSSVCAFAIVRRPLACVSITASSSPEGTGASPMRTAVVNHDFATPMVAETDLGYLEADKDLELLELTAISPLDGRYGSKVKPLRSIFSEFGLIRYRVLVEVRWLQMLSNHSEVEDVPSFSERANNFLNEARTNFGVAHALSVNKVERTTNHDVKVIAYVLKDKLRSDVELSKVLEFIHCIHIIGH